MKFEDMSSNNKANRKFKLLRFVLLIVLIVIIVVAIIFVLNRNDKKTGKNKVINLDVNSRLVQHLYIGVHDFKSSDPYWMYKGESGSIIANMSESSKMILAYLNLKGSDFQETDDCKKLKVNNSIGTIVCSDKTIIDKEDMQRSYREIFGDSSNIDTSVDVKVNPNNLLYIYDSTIDKYVLYKKTVDDIKTSEDAKVTENDEEKEIEETKDFDDTYKYNFKIYKAQKIGDRVYIYESLTAVDRKTDKPVKLENKEEVKYVYTFVLGEDNMYSYEKIENVID